MMFAFFRKPSQKPLSRRSKPRRFRVESLESRDCPTALGVQVVAHTVDAHDVSVQGSVWGPPAPSYQVELSGQVTATVTTTPSGSFTYFGPASSLGTITATVTDGNGDSGQGSTQIADQTPQVTFSVGATGQGKQVDVSGGVTAVSVSGLTVTFSGPAGLAVTSATTDSNGSFNLLTTAKQLGDVEATVTDTWGLTSPVATTSLSVPPPQVNGLQAFYLGAGEWQFTGTVSGPDAGDDSVQLSGIESASATPDSSGNFSVIVYLGAYPSGTEYAAATDIWGQTGSQASYQFGG